MAWEYFSTSRTLKFIKDKKRRLQVFLWWNYGSNLSGVDEEGWKDESTKDGPSDMGGTAIIVDKESVYELTPGGCLIDYGDEFCAAGSGCEYALGAWHATKDTAPRPLSMTKAIDAALRYDSSCGGQRWIVKVNAGDLFAHDAPAADG